MLITAIKMLIFFGVYAVFFFFMLRRKNFFGSFKKKWGSDGGNSNNDEGGGEGEPGDQPTLDLPPGVYILPPGAPDPSCKQPNRELI